jgi:hypothetical protein
MLYLVIANSQSRYGDEDDAQTPSPLYKTVPVPSRVLWAHNLEILVSTLNTNVAKTVTESTESSVQSILVPKLQSSTARGLPVPYPVHKTLILGAGLDSAIAFGRFTSDAAEQHGDMVKVAIDIPPASNEVVVEAQAESAAINIEVATQAVATFRESIKNSVAYEQGWFRSGLPVLSEWLLQDHQPAGPIKPAMTALISSVVDDVEAKITKEDTARLRKMVTSPTSQVTTASIVNHLESWAETSHTELRDELDKAFSAKNWHKLSWWKLFWRVDDVTMISSEILERRWLVSAEKSSIYLAGRMNQAGFPEDTQTHAVNRIPEVTTQDTAPTAENPRLDISTEVRKPTPWPEYISTARAELINDTVPPLQALAQRLLLQTFSTTSLSSAASALLYISMSSFSLFEASAIGVLGLTYSLRRMQKLWEGARESWEGTAREEGRRTLKSTEDLVRMIIRTKERESHGVVGEDEGVKERRLAREAVRKVREALEKMSKKDV